MLKIRDLSYKYSSDTGFIFHNLNYTFNKGSLVKLSGPNGAGKSTFIYSLSGFICQYLGGELDGLIEYKGYNLHDLSVLEHIETVNIVFQDPECQISFAGVYEELNCQLLYTQRKTAEKDVLIEEYLDLFGLKVDESSKTSELSWGQKKMICLIALFVNDPDIWLLDEPFSGLSIQHSKILAEVLAKKRNDGRIIMLSDHTDYPMDYQYTIGFGKNATN
ncbi:MAG: ABC transporter ATP-binding protein [Candidatus Cloacimonadales bacterium]|jgi:energy-coupling factor transporter ATP-binding protein EcfA2|nr:energy-coupling factor ABC transporter ATP-binding protein [Candidatus Cloacimonadota bacterium]MDD2650388.1 ABC transporter ATP-binding protein [Candidatus Cloacimonadota bacterium]MDD3502024.1 ABC transporter ATP-binding protein [Candidatus Cloacimonadota bacterium]MDX9978182.1 ABC transporter ATP-binding protein [Candidatus Cloacimonadales bacterium]